MPFRASKIQSRLLNTEDHDHEQIDISQSHLPHPPTRPSLDTAYLDLPSPLSKASEEGEGGTETDPFSPSSTMSSFSVATYLPSLPSKYLPAWWKNRKNRNQNMDGMDGMEEEGEEGENGMGMGIGGARYMHKKRVKGAIEMVGMVFVVFAVLGLVVACLGWMHVGGVGKGGGGGNGGKELLGRDKGKGEGIDWYLRET